MEIVPLTATLGAEVRGVRLGPDLDTGSISALRGAYLDHKVLFLRAQTLDASGLARVGRMFGELTEAHPVEPSVEGHPEVLALDSDEGARADVWHTDLTFQEVPPLGAMLHAVQLPLSGGDTLWADMAAAYESLSRPLRQLLDGLTATHSATKAGDYFAGRDGDGERAASTARAEPVHHPVVRVHPETGQRSLFVNPLFTDRIDGVRARESEALLSMIQEVATRPEHQVRWRWERGDLAFWDNRCTMHYALLDFGGRRQMERVALRGDRPVGVGA